MLLPKRASILLLVASESEVVVDDVNEDNDEQKGVVLNVVDKDAFNDVDTDVDLSGPKSFVGTVATTVPQVVMLRISPMLFFQLLLRASLSLIDKLRSLLGPLQ